MVVPLGGRDLHAWGSQGAAVLMLEAIPDVGVRGRKEGKPDLAEASRPLGGERSPEKSRRRKEDPWNMSSF